MFDWRTLDQPAAQPVPTAAPTPQPAPAPLPVDHAEPVLRVADLDDSQRASLWDEFHINSQNPRDLAANLEKHDDVPDSVKQDLVIGKHREEAEAQRAAHPWQPAPEPPGAIAKTKEAIEALAAVDPAVLDFAENHAGIATQLINAATKGK